ncbi:MAG TPA: metalloregulator ArsR/SmtB family transcription factor [Myxococcota bacterium]|jgi:ArsR family transcriptional regulator
MSVAANVEVRPVSQLFKALGDETRLRIVALLAQRSLCVCHIQEALALSQPNASRQLGILKAAGIVEDRREGSWVYYCLVAQKDRDRGRQLRLLARDFAKRGALRRHLEKLVRIRGPRACR